MFRCVNLRKFAMKFFGLEMTPPLPPFWGGGSSSAGQHAGWAAASHSRLFPLHLVILGYLDSWILGYLDTWTPGYWIHSVHDFSHLLDNDQPPPLQLLHWLLLWRYATTVKIQKTRWYQMNPQVDHDYASTLYLDTWIPLIYDSGHPLDINQPPP